MDKEDVLRILTGKKHPQIKSNTFEKSEYGYLHGWYIRSTHYTTFLNWNKIFEK